MKYQTIHTILMALIAGVILSATFGGCAGSHEVRWRKIPDVAQYGGADWRNEVRRDHDLSLEKAMSIGASDPKITFFFYMKDGPMYLEPKEGPGGWTEKGMFNEGDAVFFTGKPWYGSAPGFADAYEKEQEPAR